MVTCPVHDAVGTYAGIIPLALTNTCKGPGPRRENLDPVGRPLKVAVHSSKSRIQYIPSCTTRGLAVLRMGNPVLSQ